MWDYLCEGKDRGYTKNRNYAHSSDKGYSNPYGQNKGDADTYGKDKRSANRGSNKRDPKANAHRQMLKVSV